MLHKSIHGESQMELPNYIKRKNRELRSNHNDKFIEMKPNTETYRNSFYCRTIKDWNSLPSSILEIQISTTFRDAIRDI